ncbi:MAG: DUF6259 domain-containing protein [Planctomycetota bacterium]
MTSLIVARWLSSLALVCGVLTSSGSVLAAEDVVLESDSVRLVLREGRLVSLFDKSRSLEHVATDADPSRGLFRVQFVRGVEPAGEIDATQMTSSVTQRSADKAEIAFEHARASAQVRVNVRDGGNGGSGCGESQWSISVRPKDAAEAVGLVTFPVIVTPQRAEGGEKRYLFPMFEGRFAPLSQPPLWRAYPAHLFAQLIACAGPQGGFLLWTDDGLGHSKAFGFANLRPNAAFGVRHQMAYESGKTWESPYSTRVSFCDGDWQAAADIYRDWATRQPWSSTAFRDRQDMPELLRHPPLCISTQLDRENVNDLPDRLAAWAERFDVPIVYRPLGWEKHGNWVGIDYLPPSIGEDEFRTLAARLKEQGIALSGFISGYRWTTNIRGASPETNRALAEFFKEHDGPSVCERTRAGELLSSFAEGRDSYRICRGTPLGRRFLSETARQLFDLGFTTIHDDQDHGPYPDGTESCFDATHGHPIPCGPWSTTITRESLREIRAEAARRGLNDFFLTKESCSELLNMDLHAYQARLFHESSKPDLVPLVQYLYHEQIPMIFGWVTANSRSTRDLAAMLVYGQVPSLAFWNAPAERPDAIPAAASTLLDDYFGAMKSYARPFLLYGRLRRPLIADVPVVHKTIRQIKDRKLRQPQTIDLPLVIQSAWDDGHGNVGIFAVNTQDAEAVLTVPAPGEGQWQATVYTGAHVEDRRELAAGGELTWRLAPGRLGAIMFTSGDSATECQGEPSVGATKRPRRTHATSKQRSF